MYSHQLKLHFASTDEFSQDKNLYKGLFSQTSKTFHDEMQFYCAKHHFSFNFNEKTNKTFIEICEELINSQDNISFLLPITFVINPEEDSPALLTVYHEKGSLYDTIVGRFIIDWNESQKLIFLYCLSCFLTDLHKENQYHGRFKASNIIIDSNYYPLVTDLFLYKLNDSNIEETVEYVVSRAPELFLDKDYSIKSDIYSYGVIALQIFQLKINIFSDDEQNISNIKEEIKDHDFSENIKYLPKSIRSIIKACLSSNHENRPSASNIKSTLEKILKKDQYSKSFSSLQSFISSSNENVEEKLKKDANDGDTDSMFQYALKLLDTKKVKSLLYFRYSAKQDPPHMPSKKKYEKICKKGKKTNQPEKDNEDTIISKKEKSIIHLMNDKFFEEKLINTDEINKKVIENYNIEEFVDFNKEELKKKGFILTEDARRRLTKIYRYILEGVPVLLEGPTGTSKTRSAEIVCEWLNARIFKYNLSSETKTGDLLGRYIGDTDSWSGIKMHEGPFLKAFEITKDKNDSYKYCILILDEINLANQECLHFIEEALDSDEISTEIPGMPWRRIKKNPKFRLIATQNPNKGLFTHKRQDLGIKFISRFQVINFPQLSNNELKEIANGLSDVENFQFKDEREQIINSLVDFHAQWSDRAEIKDDIQCFTVREIEATIHALCKDNGFNPYDAVMTIYGARYQKEKRDLLIDTLLLFDCFKKYKKESDEKKKDFKYIFDGIEFPFCYHNANLASTLTSVFFSFKMNRHVILAGDEGCGLTKIARLIAEYHNKKCNNNKEFICICSEETKCSDLIGSQKASELANKKKSIIEWKPGFLSIAIRTGHCAILDSIDEVTSTVTDRLNPLLDVKNNSQKRIFSVPENPNEPEIEINPNFRLLCTCKYDKINQMSPAFINRFDVIVLENQLEDINENELKNLIKMLMKETVISNILDEKEQIINNTDKDSDDLNDCITTTPQKRLISKEEYSDHKYSDDEYGNKEYSNKEYSDKEYSDKDNSYDSYKYSTVEYSDYPDEYSNDNEKSTNEKIEIDVTDDIINLVYKQLDIKNLPTFQNLALFCKSVAIYMAFFSDDKEIQKTQIVDFSYKMLQKNTDIKDDEIPQPIVDYLLSHLKNKKKEINREFIYKNSQVLKTFIAKLYAASLINLPVCIYGPTGAGKTSAAEQFSRERSKKGFLKHSFHAGTKPNHFYATTTITDKKISLKYGSLTLAMKNGQVFIADEMNLSSITNMKSLAPALEPSIGDEVFIPGIGESIKKDNGFFFIACQNELGTLGRNAIPSSIASRFRYFDYPELDKNEISRLCLEKRILLYDENKQKELREDKTFTKDSRNLGVYMISLNNLKQRVIPKWSFRDITKIFLRVRQQNALPIKYKNITFYHQVLFYTVSVVNEEDISLILEEVCNLIKKVFDIPNKLQEELYNCYLSTPEIKEGYIMKDEVGILTTEKDINLPAPLLNALFMVNLSHFSEPIIFMGQSGYKTFLSKKVLGNAKTISLNQESTNAQLLGKSYPFTRTEAKLFYLENLSKILSINRDVSYKLKKKLQKNTLTIQDFIPIIISEPEIKKEEEIFNKMIEADKKNYEKTFGIIFDKYIKKRLPESFKYAFVNLSKKLFEATEIDEDNLISNFVFEFKPGLFLTAILEGKSLILKNLSNLPTVVFERFNELFSGEHCLTLQEDINNTFVDDKQDRKLSKFNTDFRVCATCPPNSISQLSEAVLSRFTVIYTHKYDPNDQKKVLCNLENLKIDKSLIDHVISFSKQMSEEPSIRRSIPFCQMINIIEISSNLITNEDNIDQLKILKIVLYRVVVGLLEKRNKSIDAIKDIFDKLCIPIHEEIKLDISENPIMVDKEKGNKYVKSKISNIKIESANANIVENNYEYTKTFTEMIDTIHLGFASKTPIILEGVPGLGKQTAIKYIADSLGYNIINIMISSSTKIDDLLGKLSISYDNEHNIHVEIIKTKLIEVIESEEKSNSSIIVFHNINHASSAVIEVIKTIFDIHEKHICLTNGTLIEKRKLNLVGIYDPQNGYSNRWSLPSSLIYSTLYYIVNKPNREEYKKVINTLFKNQKFEKDKTEFYYNFKTTKKYSKNDNLSSIITFNDVVKYIIFRKVTFEKLDKDIISQIIFAYRFINQTVIEEVKEKIKVKEMKFSPKFTYDFNNNVLNINVENENPKKYQEGMNIQLLSKNIDTEKIDMMISSLTPPQKLCLLFLACSVISKRSCILQGATSSGKSHIIRLFAQMLGQDLIVYQMNKDTGISILTGQPVLSTTLNINDIERIEDLFTNITIVPIFDDYIEDNFHNKSPEKWKLIDFSEFLNFIELNKSAIKDKNIEIINKSINEIRKIIRQENRFSHHESAFINAIKDGKWVLIDGIESAPPEIAQKISTLCGDDPELHLIESGKDNYFTRNNENKSQKIHPNFHLFVTYNPLSQKENIMLDQTFFNKCVSFTLPPIDSNSEYSAQVLHGSLLQLSYPNEVAVQISSKMSMSHQVAKNMSINNNDIFAGDLQFTGRTLKFITTEFKLHSEVENSNFIPNIYKPICNSFNSFYWNSKMKDDDVLKTKMIDAFSNGTDEEIITNLNQKSDNPKVRNKELLTILRSVQLSACQKVEKSDFSFDFYKKCRKVKLSDIPYIIEHITDTISIINDNSTKINNVNQFENHQLNIILPILIEINDSNQNVTIELRDASLDNKDLLTIDKLETPLLKLQLLEQLHSSKYINPQVPCISFDSDLFDLFKVVIRMAKKQNLNDFKEFVSIISKNQILIPKIEAIFPYNLFIDSKLSTLNNCLPMFLDLYQNKITFCVQIEKEKFIFINNKSNFEPIYIFGKKDKNSNLLLQPDTKLVYFTKIKTSHHKRSFNEKDDINEDKAKNDKKHTSKKHSNKKKIDKNDDIEINKNENGDNTENNKEDSHKRHSHKKKDVDIKYHHKKHSNKKKVDDNISDCTEINNDKKEDTENNTEDSRKKHYNKKKVDDKKDEPEKDETVNILKDSLKGHSHKKHSHKESLDNNISYYIKSEIEEDQLLKKNYETYELTKYILSNEFNEQEIKIKIQSLSKEEEIPIIKAKQVSNLALLFPKNSSISSMVANIWSLIYSMPSKKHNYLSKYLHPLEKEILDLFTKKFKSLKKKNIDRILSLTKWMHNSSDINMSFGEQNNYLWKIKDNTFQIDNITNQKELSIHIKIIQKEINYLESAPKIDKWSTEKYINDLTDKILIPYQDKLKNEIANDTEKKIRANLESLLKNVKDAKPTKKGHQNFQEQFITAIEKIKKKPTQELYNKCKDNYNEFIKLISETDSSSDKNNFKWPLISKNNINQTKEIEIYEIIIWYSKAHSILEKIFTNSDVIKNISNLSEIPYMEKITQYLTNKICKEDKSENNKVNIFDIKKLESSLNAQFIWRILMKKSSDEFPNLGLILNNLEKRQSTTNEINWISKIVNDYPLDFQITLPKFYANDLFSLFVSPVDDINVIDGIFTEKCFLSENNELAKSMKNFIDYENTDESTKFTEFALKICKKIYQYHFYSFNDKDESDLIGKFDDKDKFESFIKNQIEKNPEKQKILSYILIILNTSQKLATCPNFKFDFNDTLFLQKDWISNQEYVNKYPSLLYWLSLNNDCKKKLQLNYSKYEFSEKKLPFWLFALRILSSKECIKFICPYESNLALTIKETIDLKCTKFFKNHKYPEFKLGTKWVNFLIPSIPSEILNKNYTFLYQFFINLSKDKTENKELIVETKNNIVKKFAEKITDKVFEDSIDDLFKEPFKKKNSDMLMSFIFDPNDKIKRDIEIKIKNLFNEFVSKKEFIELLQCIEQFNLNSFIEDLRKKCKDANKKIDEEYKKIRKEEYEKTKINICDLISEYNSILDELLKKNEKKKDKNKKKDHKKDHKKDKDKKKDKDIKKPNEIFFIRECRKLNDLCHDRYLSTLAQNERKNGLTEINCVSFRYPQNTNLQFAFLYDKKKPFIFENDLDKQNIFFQNDEYTFEELRQGRLETFYDGFQKIDKNVYKTSFYPYNIDDPKINELCNKQCEQIENPYLLFGQKYKLEMFIDILKENALNINKLANILKKEKSFYTISTLNDVENIMNKMKSMLNVQYSDDYEKELDAIKNIIDKFKEKINQIMSYISKLLEYKNSEQLEKKYDEMQSIYTNPAFEKSYNIPFPPELRNTDIKKNIFSSIMNYDFLSSPFLSIEGEKSIICCYKELNCTFKPFISSLFSGNITLNFISFIDKEITIDIKPKKDIYNTWFFSKKFQPKDIPQIYLSLPNPKGEESEPHDIEADIIIKSPGLEELTLKSNFHIVLLPQQILFYCKQYSISYENDKMILCANKLLSNCLLDFIIQNFNVDEPLNYIVQLESLENNDSLRPDKYINNNLQIVIPKVKEPKRIHCSVNIKFSEKLSTKLIIDSFIIPFYYSFYIFDYDKKKYISRNSTIYYSCSYIDRIIKLHFKISSPIFDLFKDDESIVFKGNVMTNFDSNFQIVKKSINNNFEIKDEFCFEIEIKIKNSTKSISDKKYCVTININNLEKRIFLKFEQPTIFEYYYDYKSRKYYKQISKEKIKNYNFYYGYSKDGTWNKIIDYDNIYNLWAISSPFSIDLFKEFSNDNYNNFLEYISKESEFIYYDSNSGFGFYPKYYKSKGIMGNTFSIIGINNGQLFPVFYSYSSELINWRYLEKNPENLKIATHDIDQLLRSFLGMNLYLWSDFNKMANMILKNEEFLFGFLDILYDSKLSLFEDNYYNFDRIVNEIKQYTTNKNDEKCIFIHNIIFLLYDSFTRRINDIEESHEYFKFSKISVQNKPNQLYTQYCQINNNIIKESEDLTIKKQIDALEYTELPTKTEQAYLLSSIPSPTTRDIKPEYVSITSKESNNYSNKNINIELHDIVFPQKEDFENWNINQINDFYLSCIKGTRILPIYIKNIAIDKNNEAINKAFNYFILLYTTFKELKPDNSIIFQAVNDFRNSFCSMLGKFSKAGIKVSNYISKKYIVENEGNQDFISYPNKDYLYFPPDSWDQNPQNHENDFFTPMTTSFEGVYVGESQEINDEPHILDILANTSFSNNGINTIINYSSDKSKDNTNFDYQTIVIPRYDSSDDNQEDNEESSDSSNSVILDFKSDITTKHRVMLDRETVEISEQNLDGILSKFSEYDSIQASIALMMEMNERSQIIIKKTLNSLISPDCFNLPHEIKSNNLPIQKLIKQSLSLSQQLINAVSNKEISYSQFCANILVDCSCFISVENKMFNMLIICALTYALDVLTIPYSVSMFGDSNFNCIIKKFDEKHSPFVLQRILDCIFIKRLCSDLPTAITYAINNMAYYNENRKNRVIFTFTSGLDEHLKLAKSWTNLIFNDENLSFLFGFIKSTKLIEKDSKWLESLWTNFEAQVKGYSAKSVVKVVSINNQVSSFKYYIDSFVQVFKENVDVQENKSPYAQPIFHIEESLLNIDIFSEIIDKNHSIFAENTNVYFESNNVLKNITSKINKIDPLVYKNKLNQIIQSPSMKKDAKISSFLKNFIEQRTKINQSSLETIFRPNKASQTVLSNTGSDIDITALILNIINPVPDPLIYLEEKGGLIRNYSVSIIIDPSNSCLFNLSAVHTLLTIRTILSSIAALDLPCFDLIISGNPQPIVLCSEVGTLHSLNQKSRIWESLFVLLERPVQKSDLASAINTAYDLKRMRSKEYTSFLFIITDGLYEKSERNRILQVVNNCVQSGTSVFGIGVGTFPKGIEKIFPNVIFAPNPSIVMKCIASLLGDSMSGRKDKMPEIYSPNIINIKNTFDYLIKNENNPVYNFLKSELNKIKHLQDAFRHYSNSEGDIGNAIKGFTNFNGENPEMYKKNIFKTQKILIVLLWDYSMNPRKEKKELQSKYIYENINSEKNECIQTAVKHFGIEIEIVQNYKDAIEKLLIQTNENLCNYYAVWIMCGPPVGKLPDNNPYTNLVGQFIKVLTQFWKNGGALVFWAEGEPLYYQVNEFLKMNDFKFQLEGNHKGYQNLYPDESNELKNIQTFNRHPQGDERNDRKTLAHNLGVIFEGVTISYAKYDLEKIKPFIPFSRDSEGGISSMFLPADRSKGTGDIVIDCGYTKCFANLTEQGTMRYIQNIAAWTMNMESHILDGFKPHTWRPKPIIHTLNLDEKWDYPMIDSCNNVDIVFCIDATGSMSDWISAAKNRAHNIAKTSREKYSDASFRFGAIFYRDPIDSPSDTNDFHSPTDNISNLVSFMDSQDADGGGDGPEDWVGAYTILLDEIQWRSNAVKAIIHIADAPAHGSDWGGSDSHEDQNKLLHPLIHKCAQQNIFFSGIDIDCEAIPSFEKIKQIYTEEGKEKIFTVSSIDNVDDSDMAGNFLQNATANLLANISAFEKI